MDQQYHVACWISHYHNKKFFQVNLNSGYLCLYAYSYYFAHASSSTLHHYPVLGKVISQIDLTLRDQSWPVIFDMTMTRSWIRSIADTTTSTTTMIDDHKQPQRNEQFGHCSKLFGTVSLFYLPFIKYIYKKNYSRLHIQLKHETHRTYKQRTTNNIETYTNEWENGSSRLIASRDPLPRYVF
jgi:hypothetical protein